MKKKYRNIIIAFVLVLAAVITICFIPINATKLIPSVERQISEELGVDVHIEKLVLRFGCSVRVKSPIVHLLYKDGQKFGQFNDIKIYLPWSSIIKNDIVIKAVKAGNCIIKINSKDTIYIRSIFFSIKRNN